MNLDWDKLELEYLPSAVIQDMQRLERGEIAEESAHRLGLTMVQLERLAEGRMIMEGILDEPSF